MFKTRKKKAPVMLACALLCTGLLAGCGEKAPTAQELMDGINSAGSPNYVDMDLDLAASGEADGQAVEMSLTAGIEASGDVSHIYDGKMSVGMQGFSMEIELEAWTDEASGMAYADMSMLGESTGWIKSGIDSDETGAAELGSLAGTDWLTDNKVSEYTLADHKKGEDWAVMFTVPADAFAEAVSGVAGTESGITGDMHVTAFFDESTRELTAVTADCNTDGMDMSITVAVKARGDKGLEVPESVIANAIDTSDGYGLDDDFDDGSGEDAWDDGVEDGTWDDGDGSSEINREGAWIEDDGEGEDELIDGIAQKILDSGTADGSINVWHYSYATSVSWDVDGDDWMISAELTHITDESYGTAREEYVSDVAFLGEYLGSDAAIYSGGPDDDYTAFTLHDYSHNLSYASVYENDDCTLSVDIYHYGEDVDDAALYEMLESFLDTYGL